MTFVTGTLQAKRPMGVLPPILGERVFYKQHKNPTSTCIARYHYEKYIKDVGVSYEFIKHEIRLTSLLRLNITLRDLHILTPVALYEDNCHHDYLLIESRRFTQGIHHHAYIEKKHFRYCGIYDQIISYPESRKVNVEVHAESMFVMKVNISYVVIDAARITHHIPGNAEKTMYCEKIHILSSSSCFGIRHPYFIYLPLKNVYLEFHKIRAEPFCYIEMKMFTDEENNEKVHDGPGIRSRQLNRMISTESLHRYISSTFQVVVYHYNKQLNSTIFSYLSHPVLEKENLVVGSHVLHYAIPSVDLCGERRLCLIKLKTEDRFSINITLSGFTYKGHKDTEHCDYAGAVAIHDKLQNNTKLAFVECVKQTYRTTCPRKCYKAGLAYTDPKYISCHKVIYKYNSPEVTEHKSLFSESHESLLIFYSYKEYGSLKLNLALSATACKSIVLDFCENKRHDAIYKNEREKYPFANYPKTTFFLWKINCAILQFIRKKEAEYTCRRRIKIMDNKKFGKRITISGTGHITGISMKKLICLL